METPQKSRKTEGALAVLKMEEQAVNQGMQAASKKTKHSPLGASTGPGHADTLILHLAHPEKLSLDFQPPESQDNLCCFKPPNSRFITAAIGN